MNRALWIGVFVAVILALAVLVLASWAWAHGYSAADLSYMLRFAVTDRPE